MGLRKSWIEIRLEEIGSSLDDLTERLGVNRITVTRWLAGAKPSIFNARRIAKALKVNLDDLVKNWDMRLSDTRQWNFYGDVTTLGANETEIKYKDSLSGLSCYGDEIRAYLKGGGRIKVLPPPVECIYESLEDLIYGVGGDTAVGDGRMQTINGQISRTRETFFNHENPEV